MRRWPSVAALLAAAFMPVAFVLLFLGPTPGPFDRDPDAPHLEPPITLNGATIETSAAPGSITPGVEGSLLFVRLRAPDGTIIMDTEFDWPHDERKVPPGTYGFKAYFRGCDGNCGNLSRYESRLCNSDAVILAADDRLRIDIYGSILAPGSSCGFAIQ